MENKWGLGRRDLLKLGIAAGGLSALAACKSSDGGGTEYQAGDFIVRHIKNGLNVSHRSKPERVLWSTPSDGDFLTAENATPKIKEFGAPEGTFKITDDVHASFHRPNIETVKSEGKKTLVAGRLQGPGGGVGYEIAFEQVAPRHLRFVVRAVGPRASEINRIQLSMESTKDEAIFGCGSQLTYLNQKGKLVPILVEEHGIGRGKAVVTQLVDVFDRGSGGNAVHTGVPAPYILTSRLRSLFLENSEYSLFDMRAANAIRIKTSSGVMTGRILFGETPLSIIEAYTEYAGRMRQLPDWVNQGVILGLMGGTAKVRERVAKTKAAGVPVAGLWLQDWVGTRKTSAGTQLWWNWFLDRNYYPDWEKLVAETARDGGRILTYINPFLATEPGHDQLFKEAKAKGYLIRRADGSPYMIRNANFTVGMIDLSNPAVRSWIKSIMKNNMLSTGIGGWMNDFGEAMPLDAKLFDGSDPAVWHNRYPEEWQRCAREVIDESKDSQNLLFFSRSGFTQSPGIATLFWLGDQMTSWDEFDGIKTAVVGLLSGGVSGFSLMHSDIGGYVSLHATVDGKMVQVIERTPDLMMRWMELNAFTPVMRTMEGLTPNTLIEADSNEQMLGHLRLCGNIYKALAPYRKALGAKASESGHPLTRAMFLHYPDDPTTHDLRYQFMLGPDLLVAPVLDKNRDAVEVYFPHGAAWQDVWTGNDIGAEGKWARMPAPLGRPAAFVRKGSPNTAALLNAFAGLKS